MARRDAETPPATRFRRAAEARVAAQIPPAGSSSGEEAARLLHELQVHEVELELQNEELRRAQDALAAEQRALAESQSRFREIADHVEDFFYIRDLDGRLTYAGAAFDRIWGRPASAFAGKPEAWMETIDPEDRARVAEAWRRLRAGTAINETYRIRRPDESVRWVQSRGFAISGPDGRPARNVGVVRDITAERRLEDELRQAQKMEAVGTLASGVAHNLRNVLQAMMNFIQLAMLAGQRETMRPEAGGFLERALASGRNGGTLIDQLMTFARKRDTDASRSKPVKLDAVVKESVGLLEHLLGAEVHLDVATAAPQAVIMADPVQIEQILLNLGTNARDAMPGGGRLTITTEEVSLDEATAERHGMSKGPHALVVVRDTGFGIDAATKARIFEPFFTTKAVGKGTGLGLSTVFALMRQYRGCIEVDSEPGKGTSFTLCFPSLQSFGAPLRPAGPPWSDEAIPV